MGSVTPARRGEPLLSPYRAGVAAGPVVAPARASAGGAVPEMGHFGFCEKHIYRGSRGR
ncbi:hypothetical protein GCM10023324_40000 [Streptomyces youssoufiensis]